MAESVTTDNTAFAATIGEGLT